MSNIAGKAYAMNVITPSHRRSSFNPLKLRFRLTATWMNRLIFMYSKGIDPGTLSGLRGLLLIHFARWFFVRPNEWPVFDPKLKERKEQIKYDYMVFCSNFNGTWDQYIDAFSDGIPNGLDLFWYSAIGYPKSIPISAFKRYITHNQVDTNYYYNATPGAAQRDVRAGLRVRRAILDLEQAHNSMSDPEAFAKAYRAKLSEIQNFLGDPGYGPVASLDTENADYNRNNDVQETSDNMKKLNKDKQIEMIKRDPSIARMINPSAASN